MRWHIPILAAALSVLAAGTAQAQSTASVCPDNFEAYAGTTDPVACTCDAAATERGYVHGNDIYTANSAVCGAALHAGVIDKNGGAVTVIPEPGRKAYPGATRNGVRSLNSGEAQASFRFDMAAAAGSAPKPAAGAAGPTAGSVCPDNFEAYAGTTDPVACTCDAAATERGYVHGTDIYTANSAVCGAALHAGVIDKNGGAVTVIPEPGRKAYPGATRNGVRSLNSGEAEASFRFEGQPKQAAATEKPAAGGAGPTAGSVLPDNFEAYTGTTDPVACTCDAAATDRGYVHGTDIYTANSAVCGAALHAGVIDKNGGAVTVIPEPGRKAYPGVTRNGIRSMNSGEAEASFRFDGQPKQAAVTAKPVQAPIKETIEKTGQVDLYVTFRFNSAELDPSAEPTLSEVRDTLDASPNLRLALVGHTDSVGTPNYNRELSLRRARSVMNWLVGHGVSAPRLSVDGKGPDQPVASNDSEDGRAKNRRVQALRVN